MTAELAGDVAGMAADDRGHRTEWLLASREVDHLVEPLRTFMAGMRQA